MSALAWILPERLCRALASCAILAWAGGCVTPVTDALPTREPVQPGAAEIEVEVYRGLSAGTLPQGTSHLLVDVTPMTYPDDRPREEAALAALANRMLQQLELELPTEADRNVYPFLRASSAESEAPACPSDPQKQTYASVAIDQIRTVLAGRLLLDGARVWLITDLSSECAPLLCSAAERLIQQGGWLDLVQVGTGAPPNCLSQLRPSSRQPSALTAVGSQPAPSFRIESVVAEGTPRVLARGTAQGPPIEVGVGYRAIVVETQPEERIGPIELRPGQRVRVQLMDFPVSAPSAREWKIEVENAAP